MNQRSRCPMVADILDDRVRLAGRHLVRAEVILIQRGAIGVELAVFDTRPIIGDRPVPPVVIGVQSRIEAPLVGIATDALVINVVRAARARDHDRIAHDPVRADAERFRVDGELQRRILRDIEAQQILRLRQSGQRFDLVFLPFRLAVEQVLKRAVVFRVSGHVRAAGQNGAAGQAGQRENNRFQYGYLDEGAKIRRTE